MHTACVKYLYFFTSPCDFRKNVTSDQFSRRLQSPPRAPPTVPRPPSPVPSILQPQLITMYIQLQMIINRQFVVLHTCTQTLFHTQHSREMQEIFRRAHNNKRQHFIDSTLSFLSSPLVLSRLTTAVVVFLSGTRLL